MDVNSIHLFFIHMKYLLLIIFGCISFIGMTQNKSDLIITTSGYKNLKGAIFIAVYNSEQNYMQQDKASYLAIVKPTVDKTSYTFKNVPAGVYAVTAFYDENQNGKLDFNFIGVPKEKTGFSNNVRGFLGPAKYEKAKFNHTGNQEILINLE